MAQVVRRVQVTADVPEQLATSLGVEQAELGNELRKAASFAWFKQRRLSKKDAANVAELPMDEFKRMDEDFLGETWREFRPYAIKLLVDSAITFTLWLILFGFEQLRNVFTIPDWNGKFIANIHATGFVGAFCIFSMLFIVDILKIRRRNS